MPRSSLYFVVFFLLLFFFVHQQLPMYTEFSGSEDGQKPQARAEAVLASHAPSTNIRLFARGVQGGYVFVVTTATIIFERMCSMRRDRCTYFETLLPSLPTHLYMDLECDRASAPDLPAGSPDTYLVDILITRLHEFVQTLGLGVLALTAMTSCTPHRLSFHLTIHLCDATTREPLLLTNNLHAGAVARRFALWLYHTFPSDTGIERFLAEHFMDLAVYTQKRQWRLLENCKWKPRDEPRSFLTHVRADVQWPDFDAWNAALVVPNNWHAMRIHAVSDYDGGVPRSSSFKLAKLLELLEHPDKPRAPRRPAHQDDDTTHGEPVAPTFSDDYVVAITQMIQNMGITGVCLRNPQPGARTLVFGSTSRECAILGGTHKNNHVFFVAYLDSRRVVEKCNDLDCRHKLATHPFLARSWAMPAAIVELLEATEPINETNANRTTIHWDSTGIELA